MKTFNKEDGPVGFFWRVYLNVLKITAVPTGIKLQLQTSFLNRRSSSHAILAKPPKQAKNLPPSLTNQVSKVHSPK